jgi:hypothetical protein
MGGDCHSLHHTLSTYAQRIGVILEHVTRDAVPQHKIEQLTRTVERCV